MDHTPGLGPLPDVLGQQQLDFMEREGKGEGEEQWGREGGTEIWKKGEKGEARERERERGR